MALGFIVECTISSTIVKDDGTWNDDHFVPETIHEYFCEDFNEALEKYKEHLNTYKDKSWYPGYVHDSENNKVFFRIEHYGTYGKNAYKTVIQIKECFYKKEAG